MSKVTIGTYEEFMAEAEKLNPEGFAAARAARLELAALRKDAERYRWLRDTTHPDNMRKLFNGCPLLTPAVGAA